MDSIVFYCKGCGKMFFATVDRPDCMDKDTTNEIAQYLHEGHRLEKVNVETVRKEFNGCDCK